MLLKFGYTKHSESCFAKKVLAIFLSRIVTFGSGFCKQLFAFLENMYYLSSFCLFDNLIVSEDFVYNHNLP